jgi:hypothetical protein
MDDRIKTDIRLTPVVLNDINQVVDRLGISKNAFYAVSIAMGLGAAKAFLMGEKSSWYEISFDIFKKLLKHIV